jgi:hypothetical protein
MVDLFLGELHLGPVKAVLFDKDGTLSHSEPMLTLLAEARIAAQGLEVRIARRPRALPLARAGVASVILESPYYGSRRPPAQVASKLRSLVDLPLLGRMTIEESRSLVRWLRARRGVSMAGGGYGGARGDADAGGDADAADRHGAVVLSGVSMGGLHAAMTASLLPPAWRDVGVASWLGPPSGAAVFTRGALALGTDFAALARAYGAHGETVTETGQFAAALERSVAAGKPALIEVVIDPNAITTQTTIDGLRAKARA